MEHVECAWHVVRILCVQITKLYLLIILKNKSSHILYASQVQVSYLGQCMRGKSSTSTWLTSRVLEYIVTWTQLWSPFTITILQSYAMCGLYNPWGQYYGVTKGFDLSANIIGVRSSSSHFSLVQSLSVTSSVAWSMKPIEQSRILIIYSKHIIIVIIIIYYPLMLSMFL